MLARHRQEHDRGGGLQPEQESAAGVRMNFTRSADLRILLPTKYTPWLNLVRWVPAPHPPYLAVVETAACPARWGVLAGSDAYREPPGGVPRVRYPELLRAMAHRY